jgi:hypothetical protein
MLAELGISRDVRAQLLSHGVSGVQAQHYDRHEYMREKSAALAAWERRLKAIAAGKSPTANVVAFEAKAREGGGMTTRTHSPLGRFD